MTFILSYFCRLASPSVDLEARFVDTPDVILFLVNLNLIINKTAQRPNTQPKGRNK